MPRTVALSPIKKGGDPLFACLTSKSFYKHPAPLTPPNFHSNRLPDERGTGKSGPSSPNLPLVLGEPLPHWLRRTVNAVSRAVAALTARRGRQACRQASAPALRLDARPRLRPNAQEMPPPWTAPETCRPSSFSIAAAALAAVAARCAIGARLFCRVEVEFLFSVLAVTY